MHPPAPPPLPKRKNGLWGALSTTNDAIDFLFALVLPLPFAAPLGVGLVLVCLKFFESMSGEGWLAAFTIGYCVGGGLQLAVRLFLGRLVKTPWDHR